MWYAPDTSKQSESVLLFDFLTNKLSLCWNEFSSGNDFAALDI